MIILAINLYEKGVNGLKRILTPRSLSAALALTILLSFACVKASAYSEGANDTTSSELWNKDGVNYCLDTGLMAGTDKGIEPYAAATRAMAVTMIYRMEGQPPMGGGKSGTFSDVPEYAWYTDVVEWAAAFGIAAGYGDGSFGPGDELSREQLAAMLYRYALYKGRDVSIGEDTNILSYDDAFDIGEYAISAIHWAVGSAIITGRTDSTINPLDGASRTEGVGVVEQRQAFRRRQQHGWAFVPCEQSEPRQARQPEEAGACLCRWRGWFCCSRLTWHGGSLAAGSRSRRCQS